MRWRFDLYIANIEILGTLNLWEQSNLFSQLWSGIIDLFSLLYEGTTNESLILFNSNSCSQVLMIYYNIVCGCCRVRFNLKNHNQLFVIKIFAIAKKSLQKWKRRPQKFAWLELK